MARSVAWLPTTLRGWLPISNQGLILVVCLAAGIMDNTARDRVAKDLACLLLGVPLGIRALARLKPEMALLEGVARPALAPLD